MKVFIDLGMYVGAVLKYMTDNSDFDKYIGFEPVPELYEKAKKLLTGKSNVTLHKKAVGEENKKVYFYLSAFPEFEDCKVG